MIMYSQLTVLCLLAINAIVTSEAVSSSLSGQCQRYAGVYYLNGTASATGTKEYEVATLFADGTFNIMNSIADGSVTPFSPAFSNGNGMWKCNGRDRVTATAFIFIYPNEVFPRNLAKAVYSFQFDRNGRISGTGDVIFYDLTSTENPDQSQWVEILSPITGVLDGYNLFSEYDQ